MIVIKKYDVVLTYSPIIEITGHIFECFDYYLFLRQYCKVGMLFFNGLNLDKLKTVFESKYNVNFNDIVNDLIQISIEKNNKTIIVFDNNTRVILADGNIRSLEYNNIMLMSSRMYGFMCEYHDDYKDVKLYHNIVYLQDARIHKKSQFFRCIPYVKKLPFKFYKKCDRVFDNTGLIYMTYVCRKVLPSVIEHYHKLSGCTKSLLVVPYKLPEYDNIPNVIQVEAPIDDFFNKFDTYIYTPVNRKFDCSPRLVTECFMQGKKVFKQLDYYDIGLETRYNDCVNDLQSLDLNENDAILDILSIKH